MRCRRVCYYDTQLPIPASIQASYAWYVIGNLDPVQLWTVTDDQDASFPSLSSNPSLTIRIHPV